MKRDNNRPIHKIIITFSTNEKFFKEHSPLLMPIWISKATTEQEDWAKIFMLKYPVEHNLLMTGKIDYVVVKFFEEDIIDINKKYVYQKQDKNHKFVSREK